MTIAVTGAGGFVGTHVVRALALLGEDVVGLVRQKPSMPMPGVRYLPVDLANANARTYADIGSPCQLVHLAWGGLPNYLSRHHFERELPLHYAFLRSMVEAGLPSLLVTGTCYEYGMVDGKLNETLEPRPTNPYAFAKVALMRQLEFLRREKPFSLTWARLFYMWGEGQSAKSIYSLFQTAIHRGDRTFPMSAGEQLRDYLPVAEVANLLARLAARRGGDGVVNICSGIPVSIRSLVEGWIATSGAKIEPDLGCFPYPDYEPLAFWGDAEKIRALVGDHAR